MGPETPLGPVTLRLVRGKGAHPRWVRWLESEEIVEKVREVKKSEDENNYKESLYSSIYIAKVS